MRITFLFFLVMFIVPSVSAQDSVVVTAPQANIRGTPNANGKIVTVVDKGGRFELIKSAAPWYLVQTAEYVGWIHGNGIRITDVFGDLSKTYIDVIEKQSRPRSTSKPVSEGASPFKSEYVGADHTIIEVINSANRTLTRTFGGVKYVIPKDGTRTIEADGGNYEYHATAPGVRPASGVKTFSKGYKYSWDFYVVTTYR